MHGYDMAAVRVAWQAGVGPRVAPREQHIGRPDRIGNRIGNRIVTWVKRSFIRKLQTNENDLTFLHTLVAFPPQSGTSTGKARTQTTRTDRLRPLSMFVCTICSRSIWSRFWEVS